MKKILIQVGKLVSFSPTKQQMMTKNPIISIPAHIWPIGKINLNRIRRKAKSMHCTKKLSLVALKQTEFMV